MTDWIYLKLLTFFFWGILRDYWVFLWSIKCRVSYRITKNNKNLNSRENFIHKNLHIAASLSLQWMPIELFFFSLLTYFASISRAIRATSSSSPAAKGSSCKPFGIFANFFCFFCSSRKKNGINQSVLFL